MILNDFREKIISDINNSGLSIDGVYFVMKDIMNEITSLYNQQIQAEAAAEKEQTLDSSNDESSVSAQLEKKEEK